MACMKLLDSDCTFAHFACLDLQVEGSRLWRKLQARRPELRPAIELTSGKAEELIPSGIQNIPKPPGLLSLSIGQ